MERRKLETRRRSAWLIALLVVLPLVILGVLGARNLFIYMTESPLVHALPDDARDVRVWSAYEPGPIGQDHALMLKARVSKRQFFSYRRRLKMKKHTVDREYAHGFSPHWSPLCSEELPWWDPSSSTTGTYVLERGASWTWAKHEEGYMYVMSWSI
jgi:hypothetical protein